jgi:arylsulfatase A-like enzyme
VTLADFAPTFCELAGLGVDPQSFTGRSLVPLLQDRPQPDWPDTHFTQFNGVELYYSQRQVVSPTHKYVYNGFDFDELYDLEKDPHELTNVADDPAYGEVKHELCRRMWRFAAEQGDDRLFNPYATVAMAPWGPADALGAEPE